MPEYTITLDIPYYINNVIDAIAETFTDVDFQNWYYDDEPCTLHGYEDGDYPPIDFFHCDKFYIEINNFRTVKFEFNDKQQTVYKLNNKYSCDYFTTRLTALLEHFNLPTFFIIDSYNDYDDYNSDSVASLNETDNEPIEHINVLSQYNITADDHFQELHAEKSNKIVCTYRNIKFSQPNKTVYTTNNLCYESIVENSNLIVTFPSDEDGYFDIDFIKETMDHISWVYNLEKDDYTIYNFNTKRKFYGGYNGLFEATFYEGKTSDIKYANNIVHPTITCELHTSLPTGISLNLNYPIPNTDDYYNVEIRKDNMRFVTFPCELNGNYNHDFAYSIMDQYTTKYNNHKSDYLITNNQNGQAFAF